MMESSRYTGQNSRCFRSSLDLCDKSDILVVLDEVSLPSTVTGDLLQGFFLLVNSCILHNKEKG